MSEPRTEAGRKLAAAIKSNVLALWAFDEEGQALIDEAVAIVEAEATAAAEQRLRERIETLPDTHCPLCVDGDGDAKSGLVLRFSVLDALSDSAAPAPASPRQGEPVAGLRARIEAALGELDRHAAIARNGDIYRSQHGTGVEHDVTAILAALSEPAES